MDNLIKCRICLKDTSKFISLFDYNHFQENVAVIHIIEEVTSIQLTMLEGFPENICTNCLNKLKTSYDFRSQCRMSEVLLTSGQDKKDDLSVASICQQVLSENDVKTNIECVKNEMELFDNYYDGDAMSPLLNDHKPFDDDGEGSAEVKDVKSNRKQAIQSSGKIKCDVCAKSFRRASELSVHMRRKHTVSVETTTNESENAEGTVKRERTKTVLTCIMCGETYPRNIAFRAHYMTHLNDQDQFDCQKCGRMFPNYHVLKNHDNEIHGHRNFVCTHCGITLATSTSWKHHIRRKHLKAYDNACDLCPRKFIFANELRTHKQSVHSDGNKAIMCNKCGKNFWIEAQLRRHMKTHISDRNFKCDVCSKRYKTKHLLKAHQTTHGAKIHRCSFCDKEFSTTKYLQRHTVTHTDEKPVGCKLCEQRFNQHTSLYWHMKRHHGQVR